MFIVGTAGHVDHGKSALVKALTDIDPDRLPEEKQRGMTTDLGFAWLQLPNGTEISIIDVPGHERFIKNMLAGVGGFDMAILVIAADESVMPQTKEHLAILDLLEISMGIVAITKIDLVSTEILELVKSEAKESISRTSFKDCPILTTSALTGEGINELKSVLDDLLRKTPAHKDLGRPRLPIDRAFTKPGLGTVVTGTLSDGSLSLGTEVEIVPSHEHGRIRNLETHKKHVEKALPGTRVAVNLSGVAYDSVKRGDVLTVPGWLEPTRYMDISLRMIPHTGYSLKHNASVSFHTGSSQSLGRIRLLSHNEIDSSERAWGQVLLHKPLVAVKGDPFLIRSSSTTIGGGTIIDPKPKKHRRFEDNLDRRFLNLTSSSSSDVIVSVLDEHKYLKLNDLVRQANLSLEEASAEVKMLLANDSVVTIGTEPVGSESVLLSSHSWKKIHCSTNELLDKFHKQYPLKKGLAKEELRKSLKLPAQIFPKVLAKLAKGNTLKEDGPLVYSVTHNPQLSPQEAINAKKYLDLIDKDPYSIDTVARCEPDLLNYMIDKGDVIRINESLVLSVQAYNDISRKVTQFIHLHDRIKISEARDLLETSRKFALPIMEYLDQMHVTRRIGDERVLG